MLPGKKITPEDVVSILLRRYWMLLVPFAAIAAATALYARFMPDIYRADSLILVVPQQVPEDYVKSTVTTRLEERLNSIQQQILSRTRLERIITDLNLYAGERRTGIMEDIINRMKGDITVNVKEGNAFTIAYKGRQPRLVKDVTDRLASLFIEENLRDRQRLAEGTDQFLDSQLEDARRQLDETEKKVEMYRRQHSGELPSQLMANLQAIQSTELQIQATVQSVNQDRQQRLLLERQLKELESQTPAADAATSATPVELTGTGVTPVGTAAQQLTAAKNALTVMQTQLHYLDDHPDVRRQKRVIDDLQRKVDADALARPVSIEETTAGLPPAELARRKRLQALHADMDQLDQIITKKLDEEKRLRAVSAEYQKRADAAPTRETEMVELTRDYATLEQLYTGLLAKKQESKIAANLERRQIGEQFQVLDTARVPERPVSPNRPQLTMFGVAGGFLVGLCLIVVYEYKDHSFKTDAEVTSLVDLPVLAAVPLMRSARERGRRFRRLLLMNLGFSAMVLACLALVAYTLVR